MEMNPVLPGVGETTVHKDAMIFAGHKLIGGAQSPGVLVVKRSLLAEETFPEDMRDSHRYLRDSELKEECGIAGVVEAIRCGLAVQLKENIGAQAIIARNEKISKYVIFPSGKLLRKCVISCCIVAFFLNDTVKRLYWFILDFYGLHG